MILESGTQLSTEIGHTGDAKSVAAHLREAREYIRLKIKGAVEERFDDDDEGYPSLVTTGLKAEGSRKWNRSRFWEKTLWQGMDTNAGWADRMISRGWGKIIFVFDRPDDALLFKLAMKNTSWKGEPPAQITSA